MSKMPFVSVVMSVYNNEATLKAAIDSILDQSYRDFEFIVINDGSTDKTKEILNSYDDSRMKVFTQSNHGLIYSLNFGIKKSKGEYIARMDADDLSDLQRLEKQVNFLKNNPNIDALGSAFAMTDDKGKTLQVFARPTRNIDIQRQLYMQNPLGHGSMMIRKQVLLEVGGYASDQHHIEDYDLWIRLNQHGATFAVIPQVLYYWRNNPDGISSQNTDVQRQAFQKLRADLWVASRPPTVSIRQLLAGLAWYKSQSGEYSQQITREYVNDQQQLAKQYLEHRMPLAALKQYMAFGLMLPYSLQIMGGAIIAWPKHLKHTLYSSRRAKA